MFVFEFLLIIFMVFHLKNLIRRADQWLSWVRQFRGISSWGQIANPSAAQVISERCWAR